MGWFAVERDAWHPALSGPSELRARTRPFRTSGRPATMACFSQSAPAPPEFSWILATRADRDLVFQDRQPRVERLRIGPCRVG
jgi:hypothetical protein